MCVDVANYSSDEIGHTYITIHNNLLNLDKITQTDIVTRIAINIIQCQTKNSVYY